MRAEGYIRGIKSDIDLDSIGGGFYLQKTAAAAFNRMFEVANKSGFVLRPNYAFRNMTQQKLLWARKQAGELTQAVAKPGFSTHQSGLSVDLQVASAPGLLDWLKANAAQFGFVNDVASEPWHWTYKPGLVN